MISECFEQLILIFENFVKSLSKTVWWWKGKTIQVHGNVVSLRQDGLAGRPQGRRRSCKPPGRQTRDLTSAQLAELRTHAAGWRRRQGSADHGHMGRGEAQVRLGGVHHLQVPVLVQHPDLLHDQRGAPCLFGT